MDEQSLWKLYVDRFSPTRLHSGPDKFDFPGDRFIPNRSLMDLDQAHSLLTSTIKDTNTPKYSEEYRRMLDLNLTLDSEGRPFKMLVFRGSPKSCRKSVRLIDEMRHSDEDVLNYCKNLKPQRQFPKRASRTLDAPRIKDDFYMSVMDWGSSNILAIALGSELYLWNAETGSIQKLAPVDRGNDYLTSVSWNEDAKMVAVGHKSSQLQLWDAELCKPIRSLQGHRTRVGITAWNGHILTSGSHDRAIINHDVRMRNSITSLIRVHTEEVCGLKWSSSGNKLASGGNDNLVYIWETSKMMGASSSSPQFLHRFSNHRAAVKALAWCPYDSDVLASGGGTSDGLLNLWNIQKGTCINSINTKAQICGLEWNRHHKEIISGHGFGTRDHQNQLCLWRYPSMSKVIGLAGHSSRVLHLSQSPDGLTLASAGADETLRFWDVFGPPQPDNSSVSVLNSLLSLKIFPIR